MLLKAHFRHFSDYFKMIFGYFYQTRITPYFSCIIASVSV